MIVSMDNLTGRGKGKRAACPTIGGGTATECRGYKESVERNGAHGVRRPTKTVVGIMKRENMCFCETNRIGFSMKTGDNILSWNWLCIERGGISIRFVSVRN